jgi:hypothetical protein
MSNYNQAKVNLLASKQHRLVCKASGAIFIDRDPHLPNVVVDMEHHSVEMSEDAHGKVVLRVWAECQDCGRSGIMDLPYASHLLNQVQRVRVLPKTDSANVMGGGDVTEQYLSQE